MKKTKEEYQEVRRQWAIKKFGSEAAYSKWWRKNNPERYRELSIRATAKQKEKLREQGTIGRDQVKCIHCQNIFTKENAIAQGGFRIFRRFYCVCPECCVED